MWSKSTICHPRRSITMRSASVHRSFEISSKSCFCLPFKCDMNVWLENRMRMARGWRQQEGWIDMHLWWGWVGEKTSWKRYLLAKWQHVNWSQVPMTQMKRVSGHCWTTFKSKWGSTLRFIVTTHKHCASGKTIGYLSNTSTSCIPRGYHWSFGLLDSIESQVLIAPLGSFNNLWKVEGMLEREQRIHTSISQIWLWQLVLENKPSVALLWPIKDDWKKNSQFKACLKQHRSMDRLLLTGKCWHHRNHLQPNNPHGHRGFAGFLTLVRLVMLAVLRSHGSGPADGKEFLIFVFCICPAF